MQRSMIAHLSAWMIAFVDLFQAFAYHMRIDLRRRNVLVAQHHLHGAQVGAAVEKVCREGMAQHMGRYVFPDLRLCRIPLEDFPELKARHRGAPWRKE